MCVKEAVLPFDRFAGADSLLGPEMRSTGEVMGDRRRLPDRVRQGPGRGRGAAAGVRGRSSSRSPTPTSRPRRDRRGRSTTSASGSSPRAGRPRRSARMGIPATTLNKIGEGSPHVVDWIERGDVDLVINTPIGSGARSDGWEIRRAAVTRGDPVHHDDRRAVRPRPGRSAPRATASPGVLAAGDPRHGGLASELVGSGPASRRRRRRSAAGAAVVVARAQVGAYVVLAVDDPAGAAPAAAGPVLHAGGGRAVGGGRRASGRSSRGRFSVLRARGTASSQFLLEDVGPGTRRLCELRAGRRAVADSGRSGSRLPRADRADAAGARRRRGRDRTAGDPAGPTLSASGAAATVAARVP